MLALGMLGEGRPVYRTTISTNYNGNWDIVNDGPGYLTYPITYHLTVAPGVTVEAINGNVPAIDLSLIPSGSSVYLVNNGFITGKTVIYAKETIPGSTCGIYMGAANKVRLFITNTSGFITAGNDNAGAGYAVYRGNTTLQWVSGFSNLYGTVYP